MKKLLLLFFLMTISLGYSQSLTGTWKVTSIGVGPTQGDVQWFSLAVSSGARACFFDDQYVFSAGGTFQNVNGTQTWVENWQDGGGDGCRAAVAPHNGSNAATYSSTPTSLTLTGTGAYLGLAKVYNGGELASPAGAPASITYTVSSLTASSLTVDINVGGGWWRFVLAKEGAAPTCTDGILNGTETGVDCGGTCANPCATLVGTWRPTLIGVGPSRGSVDYFSLASTSGQRACFFDDEFIFNAGGSFQNVQQGQTYLEGWQGPEGCGVPVAPHNGSNAATYASTATTLTLTGVGAHLGLPKVITNSEISNPLDAPASITYLLTSVTSTTLTVDVPLSNGAWWRFVFSNIPPVVNPCANGIQDGTETGVDCGGTCAPCAPAAPLVAANTPPARNDRDVKSLFSGAYPAEAVNTWLTPWSQAAFLATNVAGNPTQRYTNLNYAGIETPFGDDSVDASEMQRVHVDFWTPNCTTFIFKLVDFGEDGQYGGGDDVEGTYIRESPTLGQWNSIDVELNATNFPGLTKTSHISQIVLAAVPAGSTTVYIDNLYFYRAPTYLYYADADGDGYGAGAAVVSSSATAGTGFSVVAGDCDDTKAAVFPGATELFNLIDDDCDGSVDEGAALPATLTACKGVTAGSAAGTTDLQLYLTNTTTAIAVLPGTLLTSRVYYATLNGSAKTAVTVTVVLLPATPGTITGTAAQGPLVGTTTTATYSILPVVGAVSYEWTAPAGVNIIGANNGTSVTVNFAGVSAGAGAIGNLSVKSINASGCYSLVKTLALTKALPTAPAAIKMYDDANPTYSTTTGLQLVVTSFAKYMGTDKVVRLVATPSLTATSYVWELPAGVIPMPGSLTGNVINVKFEGVTSGNTYSYYTTATVPVLTHVLRIGVKSRNGVGDSTTNNSALLLPTTDSTARLLTLKAILPTAVTTVTGQITGVCGGSSYSYTMTASKDASSYDITAPAGSVVSSATGVAGVTPNKWSMSDLSFSVTYPVGFVGNTLLDPKTIVISSVNGVGSSIKVKTLTISTAVAAVGVATGSAGITTFTRCDVQTFTVPAVVGATDYVWTVANGAVIVDGQGTRTIEVDFGSVLPAVLSTKITVAAKNVCNVSSATKTITLASTACPLKMDAPTSSVVSIYPNPARDNFTLELTASQVGEMSMTIYNINGAMVRAKNVQLTEGNNVINEDVSSLSSGIYFVQINNASNGETVVKKLVKE